MIMDIHFFSVNCLLEWLESMRLFKDTPEDITLLFTGGTKPNRIWGIISVVLQDLPLVSHRSAICEIIHQDQIHPLDVSCISSLWVSKKLLPINRPIGTANITKFIAFGLCSFF